MSFRALRGQGLECCLPELRGLSFAEVVAVDEGKERAAISGAAVLHSLRQTARLPTPTERGVQVADSPDEEFDYPGAIREHDPLPLGRRYSRMEGKSNCCDRTRPLELYLLNHVLRPEGSEAVKSQFKLRGPLQIRCIALSKIVESIVWQLLQQIPQSKTSTCRRCNEA